MRTHFRCVKQWEDGGYPLGTSSDTACKMFDAALTQLYGWYHDPALGGIEGTLSHLQTADPDFVLGKVLSINLNFGGRFAGRNAKLRTMVQELKEISDKKPNLTELEKLHIQGTEYWTEGKLFQARNTWEKILSKYPQDRMSLRHIFDVNFYLGDERHRYDSMHRAMPTVNLEADPLSGYLYGMYGFSLCEINDYIPAEESIKKGLSVLHNKDTWAIHALMHVYDQSSRYKDGLEFYENNEDSWVLPGALTNHNYWHMALFHLESNNLEAALEVYDTHILPRVNTQNVIAIGDASSFLCRIKMLGGDIEDRAKDLQAKCQHNLEDHAHLLNSFHVFLAFALAKNQSAMDLMKSLIEEFREGDNERFKDKGILLKTLYQAIEFYLKEEYDTVFELLSSVKDEIVEIGGSQAQRDIFELMLITAGTNSLNPQNRKLSNIELLERRHSKGNTPLLERLMERCVVLHDS